MKIAMASMFRNSTGYLTRYAKQVDELRQRLVADGHSFMLIAAEGDSSDSTFDRLRELTSHFDADVFKREHGGKHAWHSVDIPERWKALAWVCNGILDRIPDTVDKLIYVESDLTWAPDTMLSLLDDLDDTHPAVATMCHTSGVRGEFYDLWGHIKNGRNFNPFPPYHPELGEGLTVIDSAGSCISMLGKVARCPRVRFSEHDHVRGLGRTIREAGYSLWVDPRLRVIHN